MALAPESEWETDPELKAMRRDFVASFEARWLAIEAALPELAAGGDKFVAALTRVAAIAHKLAGAAETYGFPTLTRACAAFEDWFDRKPSGHDPSLASAGSRYLATVLKGCAQAGKDAPDQAKDPVLGALEKAD
jgi:HPt (histidine-containing phosphotransfer) domain-containing protein